MRRYTPASHLIRRARREAGITQSELAEAAGITPGRVSDYETAKIDPTVDMFLRLLAATGKTIRLAHPSEADFANPYVSAVSLADVLDFADSVMTTKNAVSRSKPTRGTKGVA